MQSQSSLFLLSSANAIFDERSTHDTLKTVLLEKFKAASKGGGSASLMAHAQDKPLLVEVLESTVPQSVTDLPLAPTLTLGGSLGKGGVQLSLPVDALGLVRWDSTLADVAKSLKTSICAQLEAMMKELTWKVCTSLQLLTSAFRRIFK